MTAHDKLDDMKNSSKSNYLKKKVIKAKGNVILRQWKVELWNKLTYK